MSDERGERIAEFGGRRSQFGRALPTALALLLLLLLLWEPGRLLARRPRGV